MTEANRSLAWLPPILFVAGAFSLVTGLLSDGPDRVSGFVFGGVLLGAFFAILHRRNQDAKSS